MSRKSDNNHAYTVSVDSYQQAVIKTKISIDAAGRVFYGDDPMEVHVIGSTRKVQLPGTMQLISLDDLLAYGAKQTGGQTAKSFGLAGAQAR